MADAIEFGNRNQRRKCSAFRGDLRRARNRQRTRKRRADRSPFRWRFVTPAPGREQPSGPASGRQSAQNRGVAHAPAPSVTSAKCVSCAAQNAALVVLPLSLQLVGVERLARGALADTGSSTIGFDGQLSAPKVRQPPLFVAALAASAIPTWMLRPRSKRQPRSSSSSCSDHGSDSPPLSADRPRSHGAPTLFQRGGLQVSDSGRHRSPPGQRGRKPRAGNDFSSRLNITRPTRNHPPRKHAGIGWGTPRARPCSPSMVLTPSRR